MIYKAPTSIKNQGAKDQKDYSHRIYLSITLDCTLSS